MTVGTIFLKIQLNTKNNYYTIIYLLLKKSLVVTYFSILNNYIFLNIKRILYYWLMYLDAQTVLFNEIHGR